MLPWEHLYSKGFQNIPWEILIIPWDFEFSQGEILVPSAFKISHRISKYPMGKQTIQCENLISNGNLQLCSELSYLPGVNSKKRKAAFDHAVHDLQRGGNGFFSVLDLRRVHIFFFKIVLAESNWTLLLLFELQTVLFEFQTLCFEILR